MCNSFTRLGCCSFQLRLHLYAMHKSMGKRLERSNALGTLTSEHSPIEIKDYSSIHRWFLIFPQPILSKQMKHSLAISQCSWYGYSVNCGTIFTVSQCMQYIWKRFEISLRNKLRNNNVWRVNHVILANALNIFLLVFFPTFSVFVFCIFTLEHNESNAK